MTSPAYKNKAIELLYPTLPILKIATLRPLNEQATETPVYFFQNDILPLDDINRVKMVWVVQDGDGAFIQEVNGQTVMTALKNSIHLGYSWAMTSGEAFTPSTKGFALPVAGETLFSTFMQMLKSKDGSREFVSPETYQHIKTNMLRMQGLSDYVYFLGRAKSLYIATHRLMDSHRDLAQDAILYPAQPNKYEFPIGLAKRAKALIRDLQAFKGMTPASRDLQMAIDSLGEAVLGLCTSVTAPTKLEEKERRGMASSGFLVAYLMLKRLHDNSVKGV